MKKAMFTIAALLMTVMPMTAQNETYQPQKVAKPVIANRQQRGMANSRQRAKMLDTKKKAPRQVADPSMYDGVKVYVNLTNSDDWAEYGVGSVPYGIYSLTFGQDDDFQPISTDLRYNFMAGAMGRSQFVGVRPVELFGALIGVEYHGLDPENFQNEWMEYYEGAGYDFISSVMAYDVTSDITYSVQYNYNLTGLNWAKWNGVTRQFEVICDWSNDFQPVAMAATPDGRMFCIGSDANFYQLDKFTAVATLIGKLSIEPTLYVQSMVYEPKTQQMVWMAVSNEGSALYALNPDNGELALIRELTKNEQAAAIFFKDNAGKPKAPAMAENLKMDYSGNGATDGNITFSIPTQTFDGEPLTGDVTMSVWLDGEALAEGQTVQPGEAQTFAFNLSNDNHYVDVMLRNDAGYAPNATLYEFVGYDTPKAVGNVVLNITDGQATLSWTAPEGGVNGGYIDTDNITYQVVRMPEGLTVAESLTETTFSETLPSKMERYYYVVTPHNSDGKTGEGAESNRILSGNSFDTPYYDNFSDEGTLSLWTIVNVDNDASQYGGEYTWTFSSYNQNFTISTGSYGMGEGLDGVNDWLISPGIALQADITYALTVNMRNTFAGSKERVSLLVGTDPTDISTFREIAADDAYDVMENGAPIVGHDWEADFQVETDGTYYMAVQARTLREDNASSLFVYALGVESLGKNGAPAAVNDLTITPDADGELVAVVAFTLPETSMGGETLTEPVTANIYRDDVAVATLDNQTAGSQVEWTDNSVEAVGVHTYTVAAQNADGEGKRISASAFIGVYEPPYVNGFDDESADDFFVTVNDSVSGNPCKWEWSSYNQNLALGYYVQKELEPIWLFFPAVKLQKDEVYEVNFDWGYSSYNMTSPAFFGIGMAADSTAQTRMGELPFTNDLGYGVTAPISNEIVASETGKYFASVFVEGHRGQYGDYISPTIDNINIVHVGSAKAPYSVENLVAEHDMTGAQKATLRMNAPSKNFIGEPLEGSVSVMVYRSGQAIPVVTFTDVEPGAALEWTDEQPLHGNNAYTVAAENEYGRGKALETNTFVGIDLPLAVENFRIRGTEDNQQAVISWDAPSEVGVNGGVVDGSLVYNVVEYFPDETEADNQLKVLTTTQGLSYTVDREPTEEMEQHFYAVIPQTSAGVGQAQLDHVILGQLKAVPFAESFVEGGLSASGWVTDADVSQYGTQWYILSDDEEQTSQDGDGGFALCYNGNYSSNYHYGDLITPKMAVRGTGDYRLTFHVYHGTTTYATVPPTLVVMCSIDDNDYFEVLDTIDVTEGEAGWMKYEATIPVTSANHYMKLCFRGLMNSMYERIWIDKILVESLIPTGLENEELRMKNVELRGGIAVTGHKGERIQVYTADGRLAASWLSEGNDLRRFAPRMYLVKVGSQTMKVAVK